MYSIKYIVLVTALLFFLFAACSRSNAGVSGNSKPVWQTITAEEAYRMMHELDSYVLLDVRTIAEFADIRIEGAILIPDYEITERAETELPDKNAIILIYCRSGRRSALSAKVLAELGYSNVYDFGGIINWPYETIKG